MTGLTNNICKKKSETQLDDKKLYIQSYGCQMSFSDSEVVASILKKEGYTTTKNSDEANLILLNTCSIREKAEQTVRKRITDFRKNTTQEKFWLVSRANSTGLLASLKV